VQNLRGYTLFQSLATTQSSNCRVLTTFKMFVRQCTLRLRGVGWDQPASSQGTISLKPSTLIETDL
jgi:hypothetical protein